MLEAEEKEAAAAEAAKQASTTGALREDEKRGAWFSNPQASVKQLGSKSTAAPALRAPASKPAAKQANKNKIDASEFDAW